jgi:hypothetical protein
LGGGARLLEWKREYFLFSSQKLDLKPAFYSCRKAEGKIEQFSNPIPLDCPLTPKPLVVFGGRIGGFCKNSLTDRPFPKDLQLRNSYLTLIFAEVPVIAVRGGNRRKLGKEARKKEPQ